MLLLNELFQIQATCAPNGIQQQSPEPPGYKHVEYLLTAQKQTCLWYPN